MKNLHLSDEQDERFYKLLLKNEPLLTKAMSKVNIPYDLYPEFYSYALEGFLVSFLILEDGGINPKEFERFAFSTIKRKLIDEIRHRSRENAVPVDFHENTPELITSDHNRLIFIELKDYLAHNLSKHEKLFLAEYLKTCNPLTTAKALNISNAYAYKLLTRIRNKCEEFLLDDKA